MATHLRTELVLEALEMAIRRRHPAGVIHHSDQGSQYTSIAFGQRRPGSPHAPCPHARHSRSKLPAANPHKEECQLPLSCATGSTTKSHFRTDNLTRKVAYSKAIMGGSMRAAIDTCWRESAETRIALAVGSNEIPEDGEPLLVPAIVRLPLAVCGVVDIGCS
jgi:hypothetical protein